MMAYLGPWLRRIFKPVNAEQDQAAVPDPITEELDAAFEEHGRVFRQERDNREAQLQRLADTIDDCLTKNRIGQAPTEGKDRG